MMWLGEVRYAAREQNLHRAHIQNMLGTWGLLGRPDAQALEVSCSLTSVNYNDDLDPSVQAARLLPTYRLWCEELKVEADETTATGAMTAWIEYCHEPSPI